MLTRHDEPSQATRLGNAIWRFLTRFVLATLGFFLFMLAIFSYQQGVDWIGDRYGAGWVGVSYLSTAGLIVATILTVLDFRDGKV